MDQQPAAQNLPESKKVRNSDGAETVHYSALGEGMPSECSSFAERELGETPEKIARGIKCLKTFSEDKGLSQIDDVYLLAVLRNCKYDLKKSTAKLEKFLKAKDVIIEKVAELDIEKVDAILNDNMFTLLPYRDKHRRLILMTQPTVNLDLYSLNDVFTCVWALALCSLTYPTTSLYGLTYIAEARTPSVSLMYQILMAFKTGLKTLFDLPLPLRKIEVTNESFLVRWFLNNIARHIIPAKVYKRISLHGDNMKTLRKAYHQDLLPEELGGNLGPANTTLIREKLLDFIKKLKEEHRAKMTAEK